MRADLGLQPSDLADSIYYADLFLINNLTWMIMGFGKSVAAYIASNKDGKSSVARDAVAITIKNGSLAGRYDPGGLNKDKINTLHRFYKIDIIAYCLSERETTQFNRKNQASLSIQATDNQMMGALSVQYPYPAYAAPLLFEPFENEALQNPSRREKRFIEITNQVRNVKYVLVPYMISVEEKAELYKNFVLS